MAYRFAREGMYTKNRLWEGLKGVRPFADKLSWRANKFHYENQMKLRAKEALFTDVAQIEKLQEAMDAKFDVKMDTPRYFKYALPEIRPFRRTSNPFTKENHNYTGWVMPMEKKVPETIQYKKKSDVGGTDLSPLPPPARK